MEPRADAGLLPGGREEPQPSSSSGKTLWFPGDAEPGVWGPRPCTTGEESEWEGCFGHITSLVEREMCTFMERSGPSW